MQTIMALITTIMDTITTIAITSVITSIQVITLKAMSKRSIWIVMIICTNRQEITLMDIMLIGVFTPSMRIGMALAKSMSIRFDRAF